MSMTTIEHPIYYMLLLWVGITQRSFAFMSFVCYVQ